MEMEVRPVEVDLQEDVKIGQGAVGSYEKAPPEPRVDSPNPWFVRCRIHGFSDRNLGIFSN